MLALLLQLSVPVLLVDSAALPSELLMLSVTWLPTLAVIVLPLKELTVLVSLAVAELAALDVTCETDWSAAVTSGRDAEKSPAPAAGNAGACSAAEGSAGVAPTSGIVCPPCS